MNKFIFSSLILLGFALSAFADDGLVSVKSSYDVKTTADRLESVLKEKGVKVFMRIDHAKGAKSVGKTLRPTELVVFGSPKMGTPLMQCDQKVGIDLPLKALIFEDEKAQVWLTYNSPKYLASRHSLEGCEKVLNKMQKVLANFAKAATTK